MGSTLDKDKLMLNVKDVGFGTGECLVLLATQGPGSPPCPSRLSGITDLASHCERTRDRLEKLKKKETNVKKEQLEFPEVKLFTGDAVWDGVTQEHPFHPSQAPLDVVLATDCAYHFNTRAKFFQQAFDKLQPGGRLALADICFSDASLRSWKTRLVTRVLRVIPVANVVGVEEYLGQMRVCGFGDVMCEDITEDVFPHFIGFLKSRGLAWWIFARVLEFYTSHGARFIVVAGRKAE